VASVQGFPHFRHVRLRTIDTLEEGVTATRRLVTDPVLAGVTGRFYDRTREARAHSQAYDSEDRLRLWQASLELTKAESPVW
jgi:hypothetical protein